MDLTRKWSPEPSKLVVLLQEAKQLAGLIKDNIPDGSVAISGAATRELHALGPGAGPSDSGPIGGDGRLGWRSRRPRWRRGCGTGRRQGDQRVDGVCDSAAGRRWRLTARATRRTRRARRRNAEAVGTATAIESGARSRRRSGAGDIAAAARAARRSQAVGARALQGSETADSAGPQVDRWRASPTCPATM